MIRFLIKAHEGGLTSPQVLARGVHASDARVCYSCNIPMMWFLSKKILNSQMELDLTWRQQSLDLEKRGPVRPRASVALRKK